MKSIVIQVIVILSIVGFLGFLAYDDHRNMKAREKEDEDNKKH